MLLLEASLYTFHVMMLINFFSFALDHWSTSLIVVGIVLFVIDLLLLIAFSLWILFGWLRSKEVKATKVPKAKLKLGRTFSAFDDKIPLAQTQDFLVTEKGPEFQIPEVHRKISRTLTPDKQMRTITEEDIDTTIYKKREDELENDEEQTKPKPSLCFGIKHDPKWQELSIHLIKLENIAVFEGMGVSVTVIILPMKQIQHSNRGIAPEPEFDENFIFSVKKKDLKKLKIRFNVWMVDKFSRKLPFGEAEFELTTLLSSLKAETLLEVETGRIWCEVIRKDTLVS